MTDWEKLKVVDLKEELKSRGIPLTGLKLKQQFIDKLNELDAQTQNEEVTTNEISQESLNTTNGETFEAVKESEETGDEEQPVQPIENHSDNESATVSRGQSATIAKGSQGSPTDDGTKLDDDKQPEQQAKNEDTIPSLSADETTGEERLEKLPNDLPVELKQEESQARDGSTPPPAAAESASEEKAMKKDDPFVPQEPNSDGEEEKMEVDETEAAEVARHTDMEADKQNTTILQDTIEESKDRKYSTSSASSVSRASPETLDDSRKRKRRSATPVPDADDVAHKRLKKERDTSVAARRESEALERVQEVSDAARAMRSLTDLPKDTEMGADDQVVNEEKPKKTDRPKASTPSSERGRQRLSRSPSRGLSDARVTPAIHPATCSLYMRNFKRPLHIPTLRSHIVSLAGSSEGDPLKTFYLDSIRTHAFVSFASISAASRVRNAMHDTRFPDEPMREPLWIDFVPDQKVEAWIQQETGGGGASFGGGRSNSKKYEVVYEDYGNGIEATLQDGSTLHMQAQRPGLPQSRSNRMVPQDPTATAAVAAGIHPSRASLVPQTPSTRSSVHPIRTSKPALPPPRPSDPGKGFRALDELFSSTVAKPKLYYKLPSQSTIDDRLEIIRGLRVNHDEMGQSGDEGMKRYTFEKSQDEDHRGRERGRAHEREVWVDKGPEFGFGRRGQERLTGYGSAYGHNNSNARGRGGGGGNSGGIFRGGGRRGGGGGGGGDSWRSR